ncbi:hypothetical protein BDR07DRAFT_1403181 [Suillus spraguei]|nr:hypothetical protein BDR07DRAFT_1403181 [Suillus spraguei]
MHRFRFCIGVSMKSALAFLALPTPVKALQFNRVSMTAVVDHTGQMRTDDTTLLVKFYDITLNNDVLFSARHYPQPILNLVIHMCLDKTR